MGRKYGTTKATGGRKYGTTKTKGGRKYGSKNEDITSLLIAAGYKPKSNVSALTRIGNVLSSFEPGGELTTLAKTGDIGKAGKQYVSELGRGLGSALPFLDPITKPSELASEREGYADLLKTIGMKKGALRTGLGIAGDIVLDPGNLLLAGMFKTIGKGAVGSSKAASKLLAKTEGGQDILKILGKSKDVVGETFKAGYKAKKISPELVDFAQKLKRATNLGDKESITIVKSLVEKYGENVIKKVPYEIEAGGKLSEAAKEVAKLIKTKTSGEVALDLRKTSIEKYFPRKVVREPFKGYTGKVPPLKPSLKGAEKGRVFETLLEGEKAGYKYLEAPQALSYRLATSQKAQKVKGAINQLIAGEIKDVAGNPIVLKSGIPGTEKLVDFTLKELKGYAAHPDIVDYIQKAQKVFGNEDATRGILKGYDYILNLWKGSVTGPFPAFHVRNALSNVFNNFVAGVKNPESYLTAKKIQKGSGALPDSLKKIIPGAETYDDARKVLGGLGVTGEGQFSVEVTKEFEQALGKFGGRGAERLFGKGRQAGRIIEDNARIAHFVELAKKGVGIEEAAKSVNKFLFDYSDLSKFEREVLKRIFPFYTFTRKNIPLQLEQVFKQPKKYKAIFDAVNGLKSGDLTSEEKQFMPDYLREKFGISVGRSKEGYPQILSGLGLPFEDIEKVGKPSKLITEMLSPLLKTPIERATGKSLFYGTDISDTRAYNSTTKAIGSLPGLKQYLQAKKTTDSKGNVYYKVNPQRMYNLKSVVGRFISTGEKLTDTRKDVLTRVLNSVTGVKIYTPDISREKEKQIMRMLKELGVAKTFTKDYVPADIKKQLGL